MGKKTSKNKDQQQQSNEQVRSRRDEMRVEQPVNLDRSARHLSDIDRREGEMNHGETGGGFAPPDNRA